MKVKLEHIKNLIDEIDKIDLEERIKKLKIPMAKKGKLTRFYNFYKLRNVSKALEKAIPLYSNLGSKMMRFRSAFYCTICDFTNHHWFDLDDQLFYMNTASCGEVAEASINFSYIMNLMVVFPIIRLSYVTTAFSFKKYEPPLRLKDLKIIMSAVRKCAGAFRAGSDMGKACKRYCTYHNFNANSPVLEGYSVLFNDIMNSFSRFIKFMGFNKPEERRLRLLYKKTKELTSERKLN